MIMTAAMCLALNVFFEARHETTEGQLAVAEVTLNRVKDNRYPDTVCEVVWDKSQFSWTHDGTHDDPSRMSYLDRKAWEDIQELSSEVLEGTLELNGITSTHYHASRIKPFWVDHYKYDGTVGDHMFYTNETPYR
jgi:spore germination cell wall hydrolase CwlJ-like protein